MLGGCTPAKSKCYISSDCRHDDLMIWILEHKAGRRQNMAHAPVRPHQAAQNLQQGRLAASVWPNKHVQGAPRNLEADVGENLQEELGLNVSVCRVHSHIEEVC